MNYPTNTDPWTSFVDGVDWPKAADVNNLQNVVSALEVRVGADTGAVSASHQSMLATIAALANDKAIGISATQTLYNKTISGGTIYSGVVSAVIPVLGVSSYAPVSGGSANLMLTQANRHIINFPGSNVVLTVSGGYTNEPFIVELQQTSGA